jgi:hypothetical protein
MQRKGCYRDYSSGFYCLGVKRLLAYTISLVLRSLMLRSLVLRSLMLRFACAPERIFCSLRLMPAWNCSGAELTLRCTLLVSYNGTDTKAQALEYIGDPFSGK